MSFYPTKPFQQLPTLPPPSVEIDHLMFEVEDPLAEYDRLFTLLGLPNAWPYAESKDYDSIGMNLGSFNLELIRFRKRFGETQLNSKNRIGGISFRIDGDLETALKLLSVNGIEHKIGEDIPAHTTVPFDFDRHDVTPFLVLYKFNTEGWRKRLLDEYQKSKGGTLGIVDFPKLCLGNQFVKYRGLLSGVSFSESETGISVKLKLNKAISKKSIEYLGVTINCD